MAFPTTLSNFLTGANSITLAAAGHAANHNALEAKVGADGSAVTTSHDYKLSGITGTDKAASLTGTEILTNKRLTSPKINEDVVLTPTATELNYTDGVTSAIQTQLDLKAPLASPTFTSPTLGAATATSINKVTITAPTTSATLTLVTGSSLITAGAYAVTLTSTNTTSVTLPTTGTLATLAGTETFTNKRITKRISTLPNDDATLTSGNAEYNIDIADEFIILALAQATDFGVPGGTPTHGQPLVMRIKDNGTAHALTFNAVFRASSDLALPTTTTLSKTMYLGFLYNSTDSVYDLLAYLDNFTTA